MSKNSSEKINDEGGRLEKEEMKIKNFCICYITHDTLFKEY